MPNKIAKLSIYALMLSLLGCGSIFGPIRQREVISYELADNSITMPPANCKLMKPDILYISPMRANAPYDSTKIYYTEKPFELEHFGYSRWVAIPTDMLSQIMDKKLVTSCVFKNIVHNNVLADADYRLVTQLIALRQDIISKNSAKNQLIIYAQLLDVDSNKVISSRIFNEQANSDVGPKAMVTTINQLVTKFDNELVTWLKAGSVAGAN